VTVIRVASVPASHVYVRHLSDPDGTRPVIRLDDPVPDGGAKVPGGWWPPMMLDRDWIASNHEDFDVFHVHFGFDAISNDQLCAAMEELERHRKPLVYTVHDLRNPHQRDPTAHTDAQDVLVASADELITLTSGASEAIGARWDRPVTVQPHPHVLDRVRMERRRQPSPGFVVGVHVKSLRANMDPFPVLDTLVETIGDLDGATLQVDVHDEIFDADDHFYAPEAGSRLLSYARHDHVDVRVHPYFTDDQLWQYLSSLHASVLPYRFGTHSGWLEACFDLGTAVVAPSCGFYGQQRECEVFGYTETSFDADSLDRAVRRLHHRYGEGTAPPRATWAERRTERLDLSREHTAIYERALS
jgi:hypothetical protein